MKLLPSNEVAAAMTAPPVTMLTPVYNGARYLRECIESVLAQTHENWEYVIVDNCSTDGSAAVADEYAARDRRIRVLRNRRHVGVIQNHNIAFRQLTPGSAYCKVVQADDRLFPDCLAAMVRLAAAHPTVGLVSAYRLNGDWVDLDGLPLSRSVIPGREICRLRLLGGPYVFGSPTSVLIRADLVRRRDPFFDEGSLHADEGACYEVLKDSDFGFVHQVLTVTRSHDEDGTMTALARRLQTRFAGNLWILKTYGPVYLEPREYEERLAERLTEYYRFLAQSLVEHHDRETWRYHRAALRALGHPLSAGRLAGALVRETARLPVALARGARARGPRRRTGQQGSDNGLGDVLRGTLAQRAVKAQEIREVAARTESQ